MALVTTLTLTVFVFFRQFIVLDGFQWTPAQQSRDVMSVTAGSSVTLPCEYELTPQEQQFANDFHMITWTREVPQGSDNWLGLAIKSSLLGSKVLADDLSRVRLVNGTALSLDRVTETDHSRYQCAFQSSFLTTPFIIQLSVQFKPHSTKLTTVSEERVVEGTSLNLTCTARANPAPVYSFYWGEKFLMNSSSGVYSITDAKLEDSGHFRCVSSNFLGEGPAASLQLTVKVKPHSTKLIKSEEEVVEGTSLNLICTAQAIPAPVYSFYSDEKFLMNSSSGVYSITDAKIEDSGHFKCVPYNVLGEGPAASIQLTVKAEPGFEFPYWGYGAVGGGVLLILVIVSVVVLCRRKKGAGTNPPKSPTKEVSDAPGAHTNPEVLGNGVGLRYAASLDDVRANAYKRPGYHGSSLQDLRENVPMASAGFGGSLNDVRSSAVIPKGKNFTSLSNIYETVPNNLRGSTVSTGGNELAAGSVLQLIGDDRRDTYL